MYLPPRRRPHHLEYIAGQSEPVEVIFDSLQPADSDADRAQLCKRADRVAAVGEPWLSYFTPDGIAAQLRGLGFTDIEDHAAGDLIGGYLEAGPEAEPSRGSRNVRVVRASR